MQRLENKVAVVTGAASGIGLASCLRFAREGATVVGLDLQRGDGWAEVESLAPASAFHLLDVTDAAAQGEAVAATLAKFERIDVLLTAAGIGDGGPVNMLEESSWDKVIDVNLTGAFFGVKAAAETMVDQGKGGRIINIASQAAKSGFPHAQAYTSSKHGLVGLARSAAVELGEHKITVNNVCGSVCPRVAVPPPLLPMTATDNSAMLCSFRRRAVFPAGTHSRVLKKKLFPLFDTRRKQ